MQITLVCCNIFWGRALPWDTVLGRANCCHHGTQIPGGQHLLRVKSQEDRPSLDIAPGTRLILQSRDLGPGGQLVVGSRFSGLIAELNGFGDDWHLQIRWTHPLSTSPT